MTTVLDDFAIKLGVDGARQAQQGIDGVAKSLDDAEGSADSFDIAVGNLAADLGGKLVDAAFDAARAVASFLPEFIAAGDGLGKTAGAVGVTTDELQRLRYAAQRSGLETSQLDDSLGILRKAMDEAADGGGPLIGVFEDLGLSVEDVADLPIEEQLGVIGDALNRLDDQGKAAALTMKIFGDGNKRVNDLLAAGSDGIRDLGDEAQRLGGVLDEETIRASERMADELLNLDVLAGGFAAKLATGLLPRFEDAVLGITDWATANEALISQGLDVALDLILGVADALIPVVDELVGVIEILLPLVEDVVAAVLPAVDALADLTAETLDEVKPALEDLVVALEPVIELLGDRLVAVVDELGPVIADNVEDFVALIETITWLLETGDQLIEWGTTLLDQLETRWPEAFGKAESVVNALIHPLDTVRDVARELFDWLESVVPQIGEVAKLIDRIRATIGLGEKAQLVNDEEDQPATSFPAVVVPTTGSPVRDARDLRRAGRSGKTAADAGGSKKGGRRGGGKRKAPGEAAGELTPEELVAAALGGQPIGDAAGGGRAPGPSMIRIDASFNAPTRIEVNVFGANLGDPESLAEIRAQLAGELSADLSERDRRAFERYQRVLV